jgi:hypothetical protein
MIRVMMLLQRVIFDMRWTFLIAERGDSSGLRTIPQTQTD